MKPRSSSRPHQPDAARFGRFSELCIEERAVHGWAQRFGEIGFDIFARIALVMLMDKDVRRAEKLRFRPLFVAGETLLQIAGAR